MKAPSPAARLERIDSVVEALRSVLPPCEIQTHRLMILGTDWTSVRPSFETQEDADAWPVGVSVHANVTRAREVNLIRAPDGLMNWRREISEPEGRPPYWFWVMKKMYGEDVQLGWRSARREVPQRLRDLDEALSRSLGCTE